MDDETFQIELRVEGPVLFKLDYNLMEDLHNGRVRHHVRIRMRGRNISPQNYLKHKQRLIRAALDLAFTNMLGYNSFVKREVLFTKMGDVELKKEDGFSVLVFTTPEPLAFVKTYTFVEPRRA